MQDFFYCELTAKKQLIIFIEYYQYINDYYIEKANT